jgi:hypothetical protein
VPFLSPLAFSWSLTQLSTGCAASGTSVLLSHLPYLRYGKAISADNTAKRREFMAICPPIFFGHAFESAGLMPVSRRSRSRVYST